MSIDKKRVETAEEQIYALRKSVQYDIRELTIEVIVSKYNKGLEYNEDDDTQDKSKFINVIYIPDYQRDFTWDETRQSKFIESVILGLPIPLVFVAENKYSAWEIVDGSQRIRTLSAFISNYLRLGNLTKLNELNGFFFNDLEPSRQGKFLSTPLRMIVLSENADDEVKKDMFERINRGSDLLKPMEVRKGTIKGAFTDFIYEVCAKKPLFAKLAPIDKWLSNRQEREELVLRYFALSDNDNYAHFPQMGIAKFLDEYIDKKNKELGKMSENEKKDHLKKMEIDFDKVLEFVDRNSYFGFRRTHNPQTKRSLFEAISVGVHVALKKRPVLHVSKDRFNDVINSKEFKPFWTGSQEIHKPAKVKARIEYISNSLLK